MINMTFMPLYMWEMWDVTPMTDARTEGQWKVVQYSFSLNWIRNRFIENESNDGSPCGDHIEFCTAHTTWKSQDSPQQSPHHRHSDNALWWHLKDYPFISDRVPHINKLKSHKSKRTSQTFWTEKTANSIFVIDLIFFFQQWVLCSGPLPALPPLQHL